MSKKTQSWPHNTIYSSMKLLVTIEKECIDHHHHNQIIIAFAQPQFEVIFGHPLNSLPIPLTSILAPFNDRKDVSSLLLAIASDEARSMFLNLFTIQGKVLSCHLSMTCSDSSTKGSNCTVITIRSASAVGNGKLIGIGLNPIEQVDINLLEQRMGVNHNPDDQLPPPGTLSTGTRMCSPGPDNSRFDNNNYQGNNSNNNNNYLGNNSNNNNNYLGNNSNNNNNYQGNNSNNNNYQGNSSNNNYLVNSSNNNNYQGNNSNNNYLVNSNNCQISSSSSSTSSSTSNNNSTQTHIDPSIINTHTHIDINTITPLDDQKVGQRLHNYLYPSTTPLLLSILHNNNYVSDSTYRNGSSNNHQSNKNNNIHGSTTLTHGIGHHHHHDHHHHLQPNKRHCSDAYLSLMSRPSNLVTRSPPLHNVTRSPPLYDVTRSPPVCVDSVYMNVLEGSDGEIPGPVPMSIPVLFEDLTL